MDNLTQEQNDTPFNFGRLARILKRKKRKKKKEKTIRASSSLLHWHSPHHWQEVIVSLLTQPWMDVFHHWRKLHTVPKHNGFTLHVGMCVTHVIQIVILILFRPWKFFSFKFDPLILYCFRSIELDFILQNQQSNACQNSFLTSQNFHI